MKSRSAGWILCLAVWVAAAVEPSYSEARKIKTRLPVSKQSDIKDTQISDSSIFSIHKDSVAAGFKSIADKIRFYGFDKTASAAFESFFIINNSDSCIANISVLITYRDMKGRQLHARTATFDCDIPPRQTRRQDIKSWDTQKAFYFFQSAKPRRQATPFKVSFDLISVAFSLPKLPPDKPVVD